ncbi:hypothetical protein E2C01_061947 [Portunus trituberculatus]|uniref:Uncharacterized protein n=1 Tax=Portunus trituberculatus TaxID=210409 RepID=A0A5B7HGQ1_PORTR|nr:hypothetical protein [Portunus trituberculatus]
MTKIVVMNHEILLAAISQRQAPPRRPQRGVSEPKPLSSEGYFESWSSDSCSANTNFPLCLTKTRPVFPARVEYEPNHIQRESFH